MSLKDTFKHLRELLSGISTDLEKAENGNKAASQRVRTATVKLEKIAKLFRKESIASEKKNRGQKKTGKATTSAASSKARASTATKSNSKSTSHSSHASKSKEPAGKEKSKAASASVRPRQLAVRRPTAKLPTQRVRSR